MKRGLCLRSQGLIIEFLFCVIFAWSAACASADESSGSIRVPGEGITQVITLQDGSTLNGRITEVGDDEVKVETSMGILTVPRSQIREIKEVSSSSFRGGQYWFPNPNRTRLYIAPTGRTLQAGQGYFSDLMVFFPSVTYGITDNISIGAGFSLFPGLDFNDQLFYVMPKIGFSVQDRFSIAGSAFLVRIPDDVDDDESLVVGVLFGTATVGSDDKSLTFGLGFGYVEDEISDKPAAQIGGELRIARRMSLVTENWIFPEVDDPLISYGVRFMGEKLSVDLALFNILDEDAFFPGIPFVDFVWNF